MAKPFMYDDELFLRKIELLETDPTNEELLKDVCTMIKERRHEGTSDRLERAITDFPTSTMDQFICKNKLQSAQCGHELVINPEEFPDDIKEQLIAVGTILSNEEKVRIVNSTSR